VQRVGGGAFLFSSFNSLWSDGIGGGDLFGGMLLGGGKAVFPQKKEKKGPVANLKEEKSSNVPFDAIGGGKLLLKEGDRE